jgi:hypothetical protein
MDQKGGRQQVAIHLPGDQAVFDRIFVTQFAHQERAHDRQQQDDFHTAEPCSLPVGSYVVWLVAATGVFLLHALMSVFKRQGAIFLPRVRGVRCG